MCAPAERTRATERRVAPDGSLGSLKAPETPRDKVRMSPRMSPRTPAAPRRTLRLGQLSCLIAVLALSGCGTAGSTRTGSQAPDVAAALTALDSLEVKGRAPKTGYGRAEFGPTWEDVDDNGCSTRNDILARDLTEVRTEDDGCRVSSGTLEDPYTATRIDFTAGVDTSAEVQIDHVVALSDAWQKGAQQLSDHERLAFANDPLNLLAVDGPANQSKSDGDAATWLPPNRDYRCSYVSRQVAVKAEYDLWVTPPEHDRIEEILQDCEGGSAAVPSPSQSEDGTDDETSDEPAGEPTAPAPPSAEPEAPAATYPNCAAAREAGAAPLHRDTSPGYSGRLDGDGDGVACE